MKDTLRKPRIIIACSGADRIKRGFETFATECFTALSECLDFDVYFAKGSGKLLPREFKILSLSRTSVVTRIISSLFRKHPYFIEQVSFGVFLLPKLISLKPDVVYYSDGSLGNVLWKLRKLFGLSFKLLYSNGGPSHPPYPKCDHIQQLTKDAYEEGQALKVSQSLLPYGFNTSEISILSVDEKNLIRKSLKLPVDEKIVISVASLDKKHKRIDHLIDEVSLLPHPRPFLLLLGEKTEETDSLIKQGSEILGSENFKALSISPNEVNKFLKASDLFVLPSLSEGFGRSVVEAGLMSLPCIVHSSTTMKFILQEFGNYVNMEAKGELSSQIFKVLNSDNQDLTGQVSMLKNRFGWDVLIPQYSNMILSLTESV